MSDIDNQKAEASHNRDEVPSDELALAPIDPAQTHEVAHFEHDRPLTTCRIDPTGKFVFAGAEDLNVYRWHLETGEKTTLSGHESWVRSIDCSPDGKRLYTAGWDGQLRWWDADARQPESRRTVQAHRGFARWVQSSPCGQMLTSCGNDKFVRLWDAASGNQIAQMQGHDRHPYAVVFHPVDGSLVSEDLMGMVCVWDPRKSRRVYSIQTVMTGYDNKFAADMGGARAMCFDREGSLLACAGITNVVNSFAGKQDPIVVLIDWASKSVAYHLQAEEIAAGIMWGVHFHPDGFIVGAVAKQNGKGELLFWRLGDANSTEPDAGNPIELKSFCAVPLDKCARGMDFTPDSRRVAIAHSDGHLRMYEMAISQ